MDDPEQLLKAENTWKRQEKIAAALRNHLLDLLLAPEATLAMAELHPSTSKKEEPPANQMATGGDKTPPMSMADYLKGAIQLQHRSIDQANLDWAVAEANRRAEADRIACLEDALMLISVKIEPEHATPPLTNDRVDLQCFQSLDGPSFVGPFQKVKPFLLWLRGVQIFFATKGVTHDNDKIRIIGTLICETKTQAVYAAGVEKFVRKGWSSFKDKLIVFALPPMWHTNLRAEFKGLRKSNAKDFRGYRMKDDLQAEVQNHQLLLASPFDFSIFDSRASGFWDWIAKRSTPRPRPNHQQATQNEDRPSEQLSREETLWRVHAFLDSTGCCHYCKKNWGSAAGACPGPIDCNRVPITAAFTAPPKRANYTPPTAKLAPNHTAGRPTQPPAGRAATVAAISEEGIFPPLDQASISAITDMEEELCLAREETYVSKTGPGPRRLIVNFTMEGVNLRGLIYTGSELNLITDKAAKLTGARIQEFSTPTVVSLALDDSTSFPIILKNFVVVSLSNPNSALTFKDVNLKVGQIKGDYEMILGIQFLSQFCLSVSISNHALQCGHSGFTLVDYRHPAAIHQQTSPPSPKITNTDALTYPCEASEKKILHEFEDLFPADILAVSDTTVLDDHPKDSTFPKKLQLEGSKV
ncbi:hypothetical protein PGT21_013437 [Puccinia graminis f. sp. tritici]|uniref:Uncharacterized protein n=1 Tax=Puccinia graminis f. sp. tritici TaxID=56615 RepID=A0A5B0MUD0_PUCGR|nr:hypothetical protein PGT21_013437 [Puccinia graminis f. sp. tritici]KAA1131543.1 hypothetical protein PGTUg99_029493 [Puccinia graminis f. sp. tritici]